MKKIILIVLMVLIGVGVVTYFNFNRDEPKDTQTVNVNGVQSEIAYVQITNPDNTTSQYKYSKGFIFTTEKGFDLYADNGTVIFTSSKNVNITTKPQKVDYDYSEGLENSVNRYNSPSYKYIVIKSEGKNQLYELSDTKIPIIDVDKVTFYDKSNKEYQVNIESVWLYSSIPEYKTEIITPQSNTESTTES